MHRDATFVPCYQLPRSQWVFSHSKTSQVRHNDFRVHPVRTSVGRTQCKVLKMMDGSLDSWEMEFGSKDADIKFHKDDDITELDDILGPDAPLEVIMEQNRRLFSDDESFKLLDGAEEVTISKPLGVVMEELPDGKVFIDEIFPDGNAHKAGALREGDIIVAVSLPFGSGLIPVPTENALDSLEDFIGSREDGNITLAVRHGADVAQLRTQAGNTTYNVLSPEQIKQVRQALDTNWYPFAPDDDGMDFKKMTQLDELRNDGFDMDITVSYDPSIEDTLEAESAVDEIRRPGEEEYDPEADEELKHWRRLYEDGKKTQS